MRAAPSRDFRSDGGDDMILQKNMFVERVLPGSVLRKLTDDEMAEYRRPFANPGEDRRPTLTWPRQIPIEGEPADVVRVVEDYSAWLATSDVPKLFINAEPGSILVGRQREVCRAWRNQTEVTVKGLHFLQEDLPDEIGQAVARFVRRVRVSSGPHPEEAAQRPSRRMAASAVSMAILRDAVLRTAPQDENKLHRLEHVDHAARHQILVPWRRIPSCAGRPHAP